MFYILNKKQGESSFQAIRNFARKINVKKFGHTGTLDPLATGLLLVATDEDTRLIEYVTNKNKTYIAEAKFCFQSDTYDITGKIINQTKNLFSADKIEEFKCWLLNQKSQIPPIYSAKKINGVCSYKLARNNEDAKLKEQKIEVYDVKILDFNENEQLLKFELTVSQGTYIRSLINDAAIYFKTYAVMSSLKRTKVGNLDIKYLNDDKDFVAIDTKEVIDLPIYLANKTELILFSRGNKTTNNKKFITNKYLLYSANNQNNCLGILKIDENDIKPEKIFLSRF